MKIRLLVLSMVMILGGSAFAQNTLVKGLVQDSVSHQGEMFASVRIFKQKKMDKPVAMFVTDKNGAFKSQVSNVGEYTIVISSMGRNDVSHNFKLKGESTKDFGILYISDNAKQLKGVAVTAQKPLVKMEVDKMSYSVENDVDSKSSNTLDMLRKVPMVTVDGNDNITVNGSSSFKVYVDGKPNVMLSSNPGQILKNMPASMIKNIEVVTNPGAKYDAEGVGGVLNIVMNKINGQSANMNNLSATIRGQVGNRGYGGSVYGAMQQGKLSMSVNMSVNHNKMKDMDVTSDREQTSASGSSLMNTSNNSENTNDFKMANMSMSYEIDSLRLLSASFGLMGFDNDNDGKGLTSMSGGFYGNGLSYGNSTNSKMNRYSINGSVDYQRSFAGHKDRTLTLSYLISTSPTKNKTLSYFNTDVTTSLLNLTDRYTDAHNNTVEHTFQADYSTPLHKMFILDAGAKYIIRNNTSTSDYYHIINDVRTLDTASSLDYKHTNDILAGYAEMTAKINALSLKGGLRYEHTWQQVKYLAGVGQNFDLNYGNLVPSGSILYKLAETQNIGLAYNMRISRPNITMLSPYVDKSDPTALSYGNTNLDCEKSHNINLVYNFFTMKWMVNLTLRESICDNAIERYSFYDGNGLLNSTYGNIVKNHQTGLNAYINFNASKNTRIMLNGGMSYVDLKSAELGLSNNGWQGNLMAGLQQTLPLNLKLSANVMTSTKTYNLQGYSTGYNIVMGSLSRTFLNDRLSLSVTGVMPLGGSHLDIKSYTKGKDFVNRSCTSIPLSIAMFSASYTIGGRNAAVKKTKHTISNDDMKQEKSQSETIGNMMQ
jgi:hypothetical protein